MSQLRTLLIRKTLKRIFKRQILEWPQLEPIQDRTNNLSKTKSKCYNSNNYKCCSSNSCKWVAWELCCQDLACHSNRWCHLCQTCKLKWVLDLMFINKLLLSSNKSKRWLRWINFKLSSLSLQIRLSMDIHNSCLVRLQYNHLLQVLCFKLLTKYSTMMFNNQREVKRHHHRNHQVPKRIVKKLKLESNKLPKDNLQMEMIDSELRELILLFYKLRLYLLLEQHVLEDQLKIHQLKVPAKTRELLLQNLLALLNLKKECQRNQIPKLLKEPLEALLDQVLEHQQRVKFKLSKLRKQPRLMFQLPSKTEFQTDQINTKKLRKTE